MRDTDLFQMALGLTPPWQVESCEFAAEQKRLDIRLAFPRGSVFGCPQCGQADLKAYDTTEKSTAAPELLPARSLADREAAPSQMRPLRRQAGIRALGASRQRLHPAV